MDFPLDLDVDSFLDQIEEKYIEKPINYVHKKAKINYNRQCIFIRLYPHHTPQQQLDSIYLKLLRKFRLSVTDDTSPWALTINNQTIAPNNFNQFAALKTLCPPPLIINITKKKYHFDIHFNERILQCTMNTNHSWKELINQVSSHFGLSPDQILLYQTIEDDHIYIEGQPDLDLILSDPSKQMKVALYLLKLNFEESLERLIHKMQEDCIEFLCFETPNIHGQSTCSLVPFRNCIKMLRDGYHLCPTALMTTVDNTYPEDVLGDKAVLDSSGYGNIDTFCYLDSYKMLPWFDGGKTAVITTHQLVHDDKTYPTDARTLCLNALSTLHKELELDIYHTIEHEYFILDKNTNLSITESGCYRMEKLQPVHEFFSIVDKYMQSMNINCERYHAEDASGQYETSIAPSWNIKGADDAYWFKNGIRSIATKYNADWMVSFVPFPYRNPNQHKKNHPFEYDKFIYSNGAHFNHSLWSTGENGNKVSAFYDEKSSNGLSNLCMYWIGGILKHIRTLCAFCCPTAVCYRRLDWNEIDVANWGINTRKGMISVKLNKQNTYLELRLPSSLVNPYLLSASVICAGIDGIRNKILPETVTDKDKEIPTKLSDALDALENNQIFGDAFGEMFLRCYIETKRIEIDELDEYKKKNKMPLFYALM